MINKRDLTRSRTPSDTELRYQLSQIPNKVDKEPNKGLSTNDFTNDYKDKVDSVVVNNHRHNNLGVLNSITNSKINTWNEAYDISNRLSTLNELFSNEEGLSSNIEFTDNPFSYAFLIINYGTSNLCEDKILIPGRKQFCVKLCTEEDEKKAFYTFSENGIMKVSGEDILIYKVLGIKKGEENGSN